MPIFLIVVGVIIVIFSLFSLFSKKFDEKLHNYFGDSEEDKKTFSKRDRYLIRRYVSSIGLIGGGLGLIGLGLILFFAK